MHIANLRQHPLAFIERMPKLAQRDEIISQPKVHSLRPIPFPQEYLQPHEQPLVEPQFMHL